MDDHPLANTTVVVTRAADQASTLAEGLSHLGAEVVLVPTIEVVDPVDGGSALRDALARLERYDWLVVTSANGAERVAAALTRAPEQAGTRVAAIGPGTSDALRRVGFTVDLVPERFVAEGLLDVFPPPESAGGKILVAQAAAARPVLAAGLARAGWQVEVVEAYRTERPALADDVAERARSADLVTFTSASTVVGYVAAVGLDPPPQAVACIGPVTAAAAREAGLEVDVVADPHTIPGLIDAVVSHLAHPETDRPPLGSTP